jgi:amino acid adenylation domain-containing protein
VKNSGSRLKNRDIIKQSVLPTPEFSSLVEILRYRAFHQAEKRAYTFLVDGEADAVHLTYRELDRQARAIATWLQSRGATGERVLLLYPPGLEYVAAFFGCLYAGSVAVPAYPPRLNRPDPRLQAIVLDTEATIALTTSQILAHVEHRFDHTPAMAAMQWLSTETLTPDLAAEWQNPVIGGDTLAFLQYTSGSTATPKGVMVSHANLLHNELFIKEIFQHTDEAININWLPLYHDAGLIGNVLQSLYIGASCILMSPVAFLQKPLRWLQAISDYRGTMSGGPNFAYDLCVRKTTLEQRAGLDLSSWSIAFNGAEPVRSETLDLFAATFAPYGFRREAFNACYGLAETTLVVSGNLKNALTVTRTLQGSELEHGRVVAAAAEAPGSRALVGCGQTRSDQKIAIVDPHALTPCPPDRIGEIWVSGPSMAQGYWNKPEETEETFQAYLADTGEGPFVRTGDLGFLQDGQLFITGRLKDLIIIRGRNYYPQDLEAAAEQSHSALHPSGSAAFSIEIDGKERLVVVVEVSRHHYRHSNVDEIAQSIRGAIADEFALQVYAVVLVKPGGVPKTSSGKKQRGACREKFLGDSLEIVGQSILDDSYFDWSEDNLVRAGDVFIAPRTPTEDMLVDIWADVLNLEQVSAYDNFFELGGHSLLATQVISRLRDTFRVDLPLRALFETPTLAGLAKSIDAARWASRGSQVPPIVPVARDADLPLSFSQERMWFLDQLEVTGAAYNIPVALRLSGSLDVTALEQSFNEIIRRHEILRTNYKKVKGRPVQVITPTCELALAVTDLRHIPPDEREAAACRLTNEEAGRLFDLARDLLLRVKLLRLDETEYVLLMTMHHIVSDAWSLGVLWQELGSLYEAFSAGKPSSLPELPIQYADFAHWQRRWLRGAILESQLAYWKQRLAGAPAVLELPTDRPRPAVQTFRGASQILPLPDALLDALRALGRREGATLFMTLLAAFKVLLYRYTNQADILVGTPIANRHWLAVEDLLGTFVNTLVMRTDLSGNPTFRELLGRVREVALAAYTHQDLPFEQLVEELQPERNLSHSPLVQITFNVANAPLPISQLPNLTWRLFDIDRGAAQFDLSLSLMDTEQLRLMTVEYNTDLFETDTITRMMGHYRHLLEGVIANPEQRISDLPLLSDQEQHQLLVEWNNTQVAYPQDACIHELFEAQVERTPEAKAVVFPATGLRRAFGVSAQANAQSSRSEQGEERQLTYRELNQRANQVAHYLRKLGVGPEVLVGICVERSLEMLIGLLGIFKAGGAYVPLDSRDPQERLAFILEDAQAPVLLTQQRLVTGLPQNGARVVCLDSDWEVMARQSKQNPVSETTPDNLAYVIYTSGSTGKPKGVMIPHQGLVNYLAGWCAQTYPVETGDGAPVHSSISFDLTITGLFAPLLVGRAVYLLPNDLGVDALGTALQSGVNFSLVKLTPAHLELLNQQLSPEVAAGRTHAFIIGGENLLAESITFWQDNAPDTILLNEYGPTETVVGSCVYQVPPGQRRSGSVPIGRPIANTQIYLLDRNLQPVPIGVPGELYIGGVGVARGYLNQPELTSERFIPNPFIPPTNGGGKGGSGARLYKTGDLARYLPDGNIEFLGRLDHQVKLRGFRIELEEIEAVLRQHSSVQEAVAIVREDTPSVPSPESTPSDAEGFRTDKRLVAYVVSDQEQVPTVEELHHFLKEKLPDYALPSAIVLIDALPLTSNGKVDRQALPAPGQMSFKREGTFVAPQDAMEHQLIKIWEETLNIRPIGVNDNFFELGGHSLLAVRLFAQMEKVFGRSLPVVTLFQAPTVKRLADVLRQEGWPVPPSSLVAIQPNGARSPFFCVHGMGGGVLDYADLAHQLGPDQPFYGLQDRGLNGTHEPFTRIEDMAAQYIIEVQTLQPEGPYFLGGYCYGGTVAFEMARQLQAQGQQVALLAIMDNSPPNSGYYEKIWNPRVMVKFLKNLPYWLHDFLQLSPDEMVARILRKARVAKQEIENLFTPARGRPTQTDIEAIVDVDLSQIPEERHKFLEAHYLALVNYVPQPYSGRITLFRTRRYSLLGPFDPTMGWGELAAGGVEVKEVSGFHANVLQPPYVQRLAEQLKAACLGEAQP